MSEKKFPILGTNESIDWNLIAPHEKQAMENHCGQTLEQLARRHGLSWYELLCVLLDKPFTEVKYDKEKNYKELCQMALVSEEVKQYRAIGTPEEYQAAMERNNEKTRIIDGVTERCLADMCTCCGNYEQETAEMMENAFAESKIYDPDKVVEQLEKRRMDALRRLNENKGTAFGCASEWVYNAWNDAIEIVKGGGVDVN